MLKDPASGVRQLGHLRTRALLLGITCVGLLAVWPSPKTGWVTDQAFLARGALVAGRPREALQALAPLLTLDVGDGQVRMAAADAYLASGDPASALAVLDGTPRSDSDEGRCMQARSIVASGAPVSETLMDQMAGACPPQAQAWPSIISSFLAAGDVGAAASAAQRWASLQPAEPSAQLNLGIVTALVDPARALSPLKTALGLSAAPPPLAAELAQAIEDALPSQDRAFELAQVGQALARADRWDLAALALTQAIILEPEYIEALAYRGLALDQIGQNGLSDMERARSAVPEAVLPHLFLAQHWLLQRDPDQAVAELRKAETIEPDNPAVEAQLGQALAMSGDLQSALAAYGQAASLNPGSFEFQALLAGFSLDHEMDVAGTGLPAARRAALNEPANPLALDQLGFAYYLTGNPEMAEHLLVMALQLEPSDAASNYHLGLARLALGDEALASQSLRQAAALDPGGPYALLATRALARLAP